MKCAVNRLLMLKIIEALVHRDVEIESHGPDAEHIYWTWRTSVVPRTGTFETAVDAAIDWHKKTQES